MLWIFFFNRILLFLCYFSCSFQQHRKFNFCMNIFFTLHFLFIRKTSEGFGADLVYGVFCVVLFLVFPNHNSLHCPLKPSETTFVHLNYPSHNIYYSEKVILKFESKTCWNRKSENVFFWSFCFASIHSPIVVQLLFQSLIPIFLSQSSLFAVFEGYPFCLTF